MAGTPIGILTSDERDVWAKNYDLLVRGRKSTLPHCPYAEIVQFKQSSIYKFNFVIYFKLSNFKIFLSSKSELIDCILCICVMVDLLLIA